VPVADRGIRAAPARFRAGFQSAVGFAGARLTQPKATDALLLDGWHPSDISGVKPTALQRAKSDAEYVRPAHGAPRHEATFTPPPRTPPIA
jgi:hypothetical protein